MIVIQLISNSIIQQNIASHKMAFSPSNSRIIPASNSNPYSIKGGGAVNPYRNEILRPENYHAYNNSMHNMNSPNYNRETEHQNDYNHAQTIQKHQEPSFARNFKARLFQVDPRQQQEKQEKLQKYRRELVIQMQEQANRKKQQKEKDKQYDFNMEQKFYQNIKIQAQKKHSKDEPTYMLVRSAKGKRKDERRLNESRKINGSQNAKYDNLVDLAVGKEDIFKQQRTEDLIKSKLEINKRGGYHNQSSMDRSNQANNQFKNANLEAAKLKNLRNNDFYVEKRNFHEHYTDMENPESNNQMAKREISYEEERIGKLLLFQQNMLKKLDLFKREIAKTTNHLEITKELERVRFGLKAKPLDMAKILSHNSKAGVDELFQNQSEFYQLPLINRNKQKIYDDQRIQKKNKKDKHFLSVNHLADNSQDQVNEERPLGGNKIAVKLNQQMHELNDKNYDGDDKIYDGNDKNYDENYKNKEFQENSLGEEAGGESQIQE